MIRIKTENLKKIKFVERNLTRLCTICQFSVLRVFCVPEDNFAFWNKLGKCALVCMKNYAERETILKFYI